MRGPPDPRHLVKKHQQEKTELTKQKLETFL